MELTMMQFIGLTATVDAVIAIITWIILRARMRQGLLPSPAVRYLANYLLTSAGFLILTGVAMGLLSGQSQALVVFASDILLWASLVYFVLLASIGRSPTARNVAIISLLFFASLGSLYLLAGLLGVTMEFGPTVTYILANMAPLLMYAVWVPSAILFFITAVKSHDQMVKMRSLMLAVGLLLITYSWASRLNVLPGATLTVVIVSSIIGFILLLGGVIYRQR